MFHLPVAALEQFPDALGATRLSNSIATQPNGVTPLFNLSNPFPQGLPAPLGGSAGLSLDLGQTIQGPLRTRAFLHEQLLLRCSAATSRELCRHRGLRRQYRRSPADSDRFQLGPVQRSRSRIGFARGCTQPFLRRHYRSHVDLEPADRAGVAAPSPPSSIYRCRGNQCRRRAFQLQRRATHGGTAFLKGSGDFARVRVQQDAR